MPTMRLIVIFLGAFPLIAGLSFGKISDQEQLKLFKKRAQQENRAQLQGSMRQYMNGGSTDDVNPYDHPKSIIPCNDTAEGTIVMTLPEKCMNLVCRNNLVIPEYVYGDETCNCCEFNGKLYREGEVISGVCMKIYCCDGQWNTTGHIDDCCSHCDVYGDPHIKTFDARDDVNNFYNVHSNCNYSLVQKLEADETGSYNPEFGVFAQFSEFYLYQYPNYNSNIRYITFFDNIHTRLHIDLTLMDLTLNDAWSIYANNEPTPLVDPNGNKHPMLVWQHKHGEYDNYSGDICFNVLGSQGILIHACRSFVRIYAHPSLYGDIGGLCGYFDEYDQNDHMDREGGVHEPAYTPEVASEEFVNSWLATSDIKCPFKDKYNHCVDNKDPSVLQRLSNNCTKIIMSEFNFPPSTLSANQLNNLIQSCILDMCSLVDYRREVAQNYESMLWVQYSLANMTIGAHAIVTPPCNSSNQVSTVTTTLHSTFTDVSTSIYTTYTTYPHTVYTTVPYTMYTTVLSTKYTIVPHTSYTTTGYTTSKYDWNTTSTNTPYTTSDNPWKTTTPKYTRDTSTTTPKYTRDTSTTTPKYTRDTSTSRTWRTTNPYLLGHVKRRFSEEDRNSSNSSLQSLQTPIY